MNKLNIKGKYTCPFLSFIWLITILCIVAYKDSCPALQLSLVILLKLLLTKNNSNITNVDITKYNPMLVRDILITSNMFKDNNSLISN